MSLLELKDLTVKFATNDGTVSAVNDLSFTLQQGETLAIVGESGSGKTQAMMSLLGLIADNGRAEGEVLFKGQDLLALSDADLNKIRGKDIAMIFQDPMTSLNPYLRISSQLSEVLIQHTDCSKADAIQQVLAMLDLVKIPDAKNRLQRYPHEFSGGMRQRVAIAMALLCRPQIIIADEPTTALDVTVQAQILNLLDDIQKEFNSAIIMITHDLGVVSSLCDQVLVMYAGSTMEWGSLDDVFYRTANPYTKGLLNSVPDSYSRALSDKKEIENIALYSIPGSPPNMLALPKGCPFQDRCDYSDQDCVADKPTVSQVSPRHWKACHREAL